MPKLSTPRPTRKLSVNLSEEAAQVVRDLAITRGGTTSDVVRESIALYRLVLTELRSGSHLEFVRESGVRERVHFVFAP